MLRRKHRSTHNTPLFLFCLTIFSPVETYSLLTKVNASILKTSQSAIGIYQGSTTLLLPKDLYLDLADLLKEELLPLQLWIYMGIINQGDKTSIYTYGLKEFGKTEIEIIDSVMDSDDLYYFLLVYSSVCFRQ